MKRPKKIGAPKALTYVLIPQDSDIGKPMYERLYTLIDDHHHDLSQTNVRVALAWATSWKADVDGRLTLGKCKKASELDRELAPFDFVILLNRDFWQNPRVTDPQRQALLDHEVCHCGVSYDENGEPKVDERGRTLFRIVKHSIEEFTQVVQRHGCYKSDLEEFGRALRTSETQSVSTWVGYDGLRERLLLAGMDVPLERIREWSEAERRQADLWARLEHEMQQDELLAESVCPPYVVAASVNAPADRDDREDEAWRPIADYPNYEVSDHGRVRRMTNRTCARAGHVLRMALRSGYPCVDLCRDGGKRTHHVHRLVAAAFLSRIADANEVNHIDGVRTNNVLANLEYVSRQGNQLHAYRLGLQDATGENNGFSKLTEADVAQIREIADAPDRPSFQKIADRFGVTESNIRAIVHRRSWNCPSQECLGLHETLKSIGIDVPAPIIATWSDEGRREVMTWTLLRKEGGVRKVNLSTSSAIPPCLAEALGITDPTESSGATH